MTNQPHREFLYRMAFPVGRTIIGYEVEKVQAAVDWFARRPGRIEVWGYGEGGMIALYAAALDARIEVATVAGYFQPREELWSEPIYRNVWSLRNETPIGQRRISPPRSTGCNPRSRTATASGMT